MMRFEVETDDLSELETYTHAPGYSLALSEVRSLLREKIKYRNLSDEVAEALGELRTEIANICESHHLPED